jgi:hypothetical protein
MHSMHHNLHQATQNKITSWLTTIITIGQARHSLSNTHWSIDELSNPELNF